jgi:hypothetical protein
MGHRKQNVREGEGECVKAKAKAYRVRVTFGASITRRRIGLIRNSDLCLFFYYERCYAARWPCQKSSSSSAKGEKIKLLVVLCSVRPWGSTRRKAYP